MLVAGDFITVLDRNYQCVEKFALFSHNRFKALLKTLSHLLKIGLSTANSGPSNSSDDHSMISTRAHF